MTLRITSWSARRQSQGHSAHIGQEVEVFYRWHALYGRRLRRQYSEQRAAGKVVHVEVAPGVVVVVAAWMLDAASCSGMELGEPLVAVSALATLRHLLSQLDPERSSCGVFHTHREEQDEQFKQHVPASVGTSPTEGAASIEHGVRVIPNSGNESNRTIQSGLAVGNPATASRRRTAAGRG